MESLFSYTNYREFLKDYLQEKKSSEKYSHFVCCLIVADLRQEIIFCVL